VSQQSHILLGEDNAADVYLIRQAIKEHSLSCTLKVATNGAEVLQALKESLDGDPALAGHASGSSAFDLVILDLNLPRHDGLEILRFIRETKELAHLIVVILTSSDSPADTKAATELGANQYIRKPSNLESFMEIGAALQSLLANRCKAASVQSA
jgi:CheY-like chemotaxis protein